MIKYDEKTQTIKYKNNSYNTCDNVDMKIFVNKIAGVLKQKENIESRTSITISDIFQEVDFGDVYDILKVPIYCITFAGDEYGFDIFAVTKSGIFLIQNDYFKVGV